MRLECSNAARCTSPHGVSTRVIDSPASTLAVDPVGIFSVFGPLVSALTRQGYTFGHDLTPHVYDTRCVTLVHAYIAVLRSVPDFLAVFLMF